MHSYVKAVNFSCRLQKLQQDTHVNSHCDKQNELPNAKKKTALFHVTQDECLWYCGYNHHNFLPLLVHPRTKAFPKLHLSDWSELVN